MYPTSWDNHSISGGQFNFHDFVDEISKPGGTLKLRTGPSLVGSKVGRSRFNKVEDLQKTVGDMQIDIV